jgi:CorA-like Mg2+ transporter protein
MPLSIALPISSKPLAQNSTEYRPSFSARSRPQRPPCRTFVGRLMAPPRHSRPTRAGGRIMAMFLCESADATILSVRFAKAEWVWAGSFLQEDRKKVAVAGAKELGSHLKTVAADLGSLGDHTSYLSSKANFLLDTTLGLINIEQDGIIKIFSVAAVVLLPPTLVASVYGMNFEVMPELKWLFGYPFALAVMATSAIVPYLLFKKKGWL